MSYLLAARIYGGSNPMADHNLFSGIGDKKNKNKKKQLHLPNRFSRRARSTEKYAHTRAIYIRRYIDRFRFTLTRIARGENSKIKLMIRAMDVSRRLQQYTLRVNCVARIDFEKNGKLRTKSDRFRSRVCVTNYTPSFCPFNRLDIFIFPDTIGTFRRECVRVYLHRSVHTYRRMH